jgi:membrane protease YdiL (CAAX protease family)
MLFLLKRSASGALAGLVVLAAAAMFLRADLGVESPKLSATPRLIGESGLLFGVILLSDGCIHGLLMLAFGAAYRQRYHELAKIFHGQRFVAMFAGALMAGVGEELVFRGLGTGLIYLVTAAFAFGLLHHLRGRLALFTLWSVWEGLLLAAGLWLTGALVVTMLAHFLHDLTGFLIFRVERNRRLLFSLTDRGSGA